MTRRTFLQSCLAAAASMLMPAAKAAGLVALPNQKQWCVPVKRVSIHDRAAFAEYREDFYQKLLKQVAKP